MKNLKFLIIAAFSVFTLFACEENTNTETVKAEMKETVKKVESIYDKESAILKTQLENAKVKVDEEIKKLKIKWTVATGETKIELSQELDELEYHQAKLANDLKHIGDKVENGWEKFKANAKETLEKVDEDLEEINESL